MNYRIYIHRDINNKIFYVGCTKDKKRPYRKYSISANKSNPRSKEWFKRCNNQFTVEIYKDNLTEEQAYELEIELIAKYKRKVDGGILVNKSTGGKYGGNGIYHSKQTKQKMSEEHSGKKLSDDTKNKISNTLKGIKRSSETKIKISEAQKGEKHRMYGKPAINRKQVICIETNKIWNSIKDCAEDNNINYITLKNKLSGHNKNNTTFMYLDEYEESEMVLDSIAQILNNLK